MITILIPTTAERRERLNMCLKSIFENTSDIEYRVVIFENNIGWTKAVHKALDGIDGYVVLLGSDVTVEKGWLKTLNDRFFERFPLGDGVAVPYDEIQNGNLATHPFAHSTTLKKYISTEYFHCFSDNEMTMRLKAEDKYLYVPDAVINHHHYVNKKAEEDDTYKAIYGANMDKDREVFKMRMQNGFKDIKQGIVISTSSHTEAFFTDLMKSLKGVGYPILVVGNGGYNGKDVEIVNSWNGFELGAIKWGAEEFDEFVYLQDTVLVKDISIFKTLFEDFKGKSVAIGERYYSYLGKYQSEICKTIGIPVVNSKKEAVEQEISGFCRKYNDATMDRPVIQELPVATDVYEEKHGRNNQVAETAHFIKYKGCWDTSMI